MLANTAIILDWGDVTQKPAQDNCEPPCVGKHEGQDGSLTSPMPLGRRRLGFVLALAPLTGITLPVQARINGELGIRVDDGIFAGIISFCVSILVMGIALVCTRRGRESFGSLVAGTRNGSFPWHLHLAGAIAAYFILGMTFFAVVTGVAVYTIASVAGQTLSALVIDRVGFGPGGRRPIAPARVVAAMLTLAAVTYAVSPLLTLRQDVALLLLPVAFVMFAGILVSIQQAMNSILAVHLRSPMPVTLTNYIVGSSILALIWLVKFGIDGRAPSLPSEPWLYLGGALGCLNLLVSTVLLHRLGALLTGLGLISGQLIGALLVDWLLPAPGRVVHIETLLGTALALMAMVLAASRQRALGQKG